MGCHLNKNSKGIKILIPNMLTFVKISDKDGNNTIKPFYSLTEDEKKAYRDKNNNDVTFNNQKLVGFSIGHVFDMKDTNLSMDQINQELNPNMDDDRAKDIIDTFIKTIYKDGFKVEFKDLGHDTAKGYCDHAHKKIIVRKSLSNLMQMKVLIHEYGHALAHKHLENNNMEYQQHRNKYETEAESIAYVVSKYLGMQTTDYSLDYLYSWSKEKDFKEIDDSLSTIVNYSKRIIKNFEKLSNRELDFNNKSTLKI